MICVQSKLIKTAAIWLVNTEHMQLPAFSKLMVQELQKNNNETAEKFQKY